MLNPKRIFLLISKTASNFLQYSYIHKKQTLEYKTLNQTRKLIKASIEIRKLVLITTH